MQAKSDTSYFEMASWRMVHRKQPPPAPKKPTEASLHEAALAYLARYAATQAGVIRVLDRRVANWARSVPEIEPQELASLRVMVRREAARLVQVGLINDAEFAASRARSLTRAGRSRRAVSAHLGAKGIDSDIVQTALPDDPDAEFAACVVLVRKRRLGPYRNPDREPDRMRELAVLARAGFSHSIAARALDLDAEAAEDLIIQLRSS
jgi:regulatory protein